MKKLLLLVFVALLADLTFAQIPVRLATEKEKTELEKVLEAKYSLMIRTDNKFGELGPMFGGYSCKVKGITIKSTKDNVFVKGVYIKISESPLRESFLDYSEIDGLLDFLQEAKDIFKNKSTNDNTIELIYNATSFKLSVIRGIAKKDVLYIGNEVYDFEKNADVFIKALEDAKKWLNEQN